MLTDEQRNDIRLEIAHSEAVISKKSWVRDLAQRCGAIDPSTVADALEDRFEIVGNGMRSKTGHGNLETVAEYLAAYPSLKTPEQEPTGTGLHHD